MSSLEEEASNYVLNNTEKLDEHIKEELENIKLYKIMLLTGKSLEINHLLTCIKLMYYLDKIPLPDDIISMSSGPLYKKSVSYATDIISGNTIKIIRHLSEEEENTDIRLDILSYKILSSNRWCHFKQILYSEISPNFENFKLFLEERTIKFLERNDIDEDIKMKTRNVIQDMKKYESLTIYEVFSLIGYVFGEIIKMEIINPAELLVDSNTFKDFMENLNNSKRALGYLVDIGKSLEHTRLVDITGITNGNITNNPVFEFLV
jgi:hypothetical protein